MGAFRVCVRSDFCWFTRRWTKYDKLPIQHHLAFFCQKQINEKWKDFKFKALKNCSNRQPYYSNGNLRGLRGAILILDISSDLGMLYVQVLDCVNVVTQWLRMNNTLGRPCSGFNLVFSCQDDQRVCHIHMHYRYRIRSIVGWRCPSKT